MTTWTTFERFQPNTIRKLCFSLARMTKFQDKAVFSALAEAIERQPLIEFMVDPKNVLGLLWSFACLDYLHFLDKVLKDDSVKGIDIPPIKKTYQCMQLNQIVVSWKLKNADQPLPVLLEKLLLHAEMNE